MPRAPPAHLEINSSLANQQAAVHPYSRPLISPGLLTVPVTSSPLRTSPPVIAGRLPPTEAIPLAPLQTYERASKSKDSRRNKQLTPAVPPPVAVAAVPVVRKCRKKGCDGVVELVDQPGYKGWACQACSAEDQAMNEQSSYIREDVTLRVFNATSGPRGSAEIFNTSTGDYVTEAIKVSRVEISLQH
jgi:hypothetical protein